MNGVVTLVGIEIKEMDMEVVVMQGREAWRWNKKIFSRIIYIHTHARVHIF